MGNKWTKTQLKELLVPKGYIRGPFGSALRRNELLDRGIPVYEQQNVIRKNQNFRFFIDDKKFEEMKRFAVQANDLLISCSGTIGEVALITNSDAKGIISQALLALRPNTAKVAPKYLLYFFKSAEGHNSIISRSSGSVQVNIAKREVIESIPLFVPSLPEQNAIIATLSSLDDKIELNNRIIANLEAQAQAIFKSWFVDFEPFQDGEFEESELGLIPKGWRVGTLDELIDIRYGKDHKKLSDGNIPVYGSGGIMRFADEAIYIGESVLIPRKGTLSNVLYVTGQFWTVDTMFYTIMRKNNIAKFVYLFVLGLDLSSMNSGSAVPSMTTNILNAIQLVIPKDEGFERFETAVSPMYKAMKLLEKQNERLAQLRDTLLPKLMSGEIEVPVSE